jgi:hypothetical protein
MPISPNAAPDELDSPFFIKNEEVCRTFDEFIISLDGETRGNYNAFSYNILGEIRHPNEWEFNIKKSSFTSGNLLLSSKYQSLNIASKWTAKNLPSDCPEFFIRRKRFTDSFITSGSKKSNWLSTSQRYVIKPQEPSHYFIKELEVKIKDLIRSGQVWEVRYENNMLSIDLRTDQIHTGIIKDLIQKTYT